MIMKRFAAAFVAALLITAPLAAALTAKPAEPLHISQGQEVQLADYLLAGKTVVFDFTSKFCPPCRAYDEPLKALHAKRDDVVIVKVDINRPETRGIDWKSPVARQFELQSIPHFKVYSPDGKLVAEDKVVITNGQYDEAASSSAARQLVDDWIAKL